MTLQRSRALNTQQGNFEHPRLGTMYYQIWRPVSAAKAVILVVHGAGEHCDRYRHFAEYFTARGYAVAALDHPGHGKSDGIPGFIGRFDDYIETLRAFQQRVDNNFPQLPKVLLGHSMGGLVSALYLLEKQDEFVGCVMSGPLIKSELAPGAVQMVAVRVLSVLLPRLGILSLDPKGVSRDPEVVADYVDDPLVHHGKFSVRWVRELFAAMNRIQERAADITLPMLIMHGGQDSMTSPAGSHLLHDRISSASKSLKIYDELYHEIFLEPEKEQVLGDLLAWMDELLTPDSD